MKANIAFCCVALLGLLAALPVSASDCSNKLNTVVSPMADAESKPFIEWVAKQSKLGNDFFGSNSTKLYKIDINNDGVEEIVSESYQGSGGFLKLSIFLKDKNSFILGPELPRVGLRDGDGVAQGGFYNPMTKKSELFVNHCGKLIINFNNDSYLWNKDKLLPYCSQDWIDGRRNVFQLLYQDKQFESAYEVLKGITSFCSKYISESKRMWAENDLALAALKMGGPETCLEHIGSIEKSKDFAKSESKLKDSVKYNKKLCIEGKEASANALDVFGYDYSWLLTFKGKDSNTIMLDDRSKLLLKMIVPNVQTDLHVTANGFREAVEVRLFGPPEDVQVINERFVIFSACQSHDCGAKGMIWIDVQKRLSAAAIADTVDGLLVGTRSFVEADFPPELKLAIEEWLIREKLKVSKRAFVTSLTYSKNGRRHN